MDEEPRFQQIREEIEAKQRAILWPDGLNGGRSTDEFLWKGDPKAKPIQRAGLVVFGLFFWLMGVLIIALGWAKDEGVACLVMSLLGSAFVLVAMRLLRNAFLRPNTIPKDEKDRGE